MKKKILILLVTVIGFFSCQDVLDIAPDGRKSLDDIFQDDATVGAYLNSCYTNFPEYGLNNYYHTNYRIALSDDAWEGKGPQVAPIYAGALTSSLSVLETEISTTGGWDNIGGFWTNYWANIRRCNVFLSKIGTAKVILETDRSRWTAEAKALRAFYNLELIKHYGTMPIINSPIGFDYDYANLKRESFKASIDNIVNDCNQAMASPNFPWRITAANEKYRFTKAVAASIKSQAILFAASDLFNDGNNYWDEAEKITKSALDDCLSNGYQLYTTLLNPTLFQTAYHELFCLAPEISENPSDKESILTTRYGGANFWDIAGLKMMSPTKCGIMPTQELVDAYGMKTTGQPILKLEQPYLDEKHLEPNYNPTSGYDPQNPYVDRDPRFYATVYANGSTRKNRLGVVTTIETWFGGNNGIEPSNDKATGTGYYPKKYDFPNNGVTGTTAVNVSYRAFRLAELYLNYAEAANENGHTTEAIAAINVIRARVDMPSIDAAGLSKEQARLLIRNERRVEMAHEEVRYYDIRRWMKPNQDLSSTVRYVTAMWIIRKGTAPNYTFEYKRCVAGDTWNSTSNKWNDTGKERLCFSNKYLFWPIPLEEAKRLYGASGIQWQNPGW